MQVNVRGLDFYLQLNSTVSDGLITSNCNIATGWASYAGVTRTLGCLRASNIEPVNTFIYKQTLEQHIPDMIVQDEIIKTDKSPWQGDILPDFDWRNVDDVSYVQPARD